MANLWVVLWPLWLLWISKWAWNHQMSPLITYESPRVGNLVLIEMVWRDGWTIMVVRVSRLTLSYIFKSQPKANKGLCWDLGILPQLTKNVIKSMYYVDTKIKQSTYTSNRQDTWVLMHMHAGQSKKRGSPHAQLSLSLSYICNLKLPIGDIYITDYGKNRIRKSVCKVARSQQSLGMTMLDTMVTVFLRWVQS